MGADKRVVGATLVIAQGGHEGRPYEESSLSSLGERVDRTGVFSGRGGPSEGVSIQSGGVYGCNLKKRVS